MGTICLFLGVLLLASVGAASKESHVSAVFVLDSSAASDYQGHATAKSLAFSLASSLQNGSVISVINTAKQGEIAVAPTVTPLSSRVFEGIPFLGSDSFNLTDALNKADALLQPQTDGLKMVIVLSGRELSCNHNASCRLVKLLAAKGIIVWNIALKFPELHSWPLQEASTPCYSIKADRNVHANFERLVRFAAQESTEISERNCPHIAEAPKNLVHSMRSGRTMIKSSASLTTIPEIACSSNYSNVWLQFIFIVDSSSAVATDGFLTQTAVIGDVVKELRIGLRPGHSRVGIIEVGDKANVVLDPKNSVNSNAVFAALRTMQFANDRSLNVQAGLDAALQLYDSQPHDDNVRTFFVLFSSKTIECSHNSEFLSPCRAAAMLRDRGTFATIALSFSDAVQPPIDIATPCYALNSKSNIVADILHAATRVNCFCPRYFEQMIDGCVPSRTCIYETAVGEAEFQDAHDQCAERGAFIATIKNPAKEQFLRKKAQRSNLTSFWTGIKLMSGINAIGKWDDGTSFKRGDYNQFTGNLEAGMCSAVRFDGSSEALWIQEACNSAEPFFCEVAAFDADSKH